MKNSFLLVFLFFFSVAASAQIRVEKRHYNKGWYISFNHKKNFSDKKSEVPSPENSVEAFQKPDSIPNEEEMIGNENLTNEPETISLSQTSSPDSVLPKHNSVSVKTGPVKTEKNLSAKMEKPVPVKQIAENKTAQSIPVSHANRAEKISGQYGSDEGWMDFVESLIESLVVAILIIAVIFGLILVGLGALIALYPAAAIGVLATLGLISLIVTL